MIRIPIAAFSIGLTLLPLTALAQDASRSGCTVGSSGTLTITSGDPLVRASSTAIWSDMRSDSGTAADGLRARIAAFLADPENVQVLADIAQATCDNTVLGTGGAEGVMAPLRTYTSGRSPECQGLINDITNPDLDDRTRRRVAGATAARVFEVARYVFWIYNTTPPSAMRGEALGRGTGSDLGDVSRDGGAPVSTYDRSHRVLRAARLLRAVTNALPGAPRSGRGRSRRRGGGSSTPNFHSEFQNYLNEARAFATITGCMPQAEPRFARATVSSESSMTVSDAMREASRRSVPADAEQVISEVMGGASAGD